MRVGQKVKASDGQQGKTYYLDYSGPYRIWLIHCGDNINRAYLEDQLTPLEEPPIVAVCQRLQWAWGEESKTQLWICDHASSVGRGAMTRQEQIDKILTWCGLYKANAGDGLEGWFESPKPGAFVAYCHQCDPFRHPAACARVMDEVVKRGKYLLIEYLPSVKNWSCRLSDGWPCTEESITRGYGATESEAKMNALLEAI